MVAVQQTEAVAPAPSAAADAAAVVGDAATARSAAAAAEQSDSAAAAAAPSKRPELCRHWGRTGSCLLGDRCRFAHPADGPHTPGAPPPSAAAGVVAPPPPRRRAWGGARAAVRNRSKATVLRRHALDAFGREALAAGSGVLDVAGGKGEVAFQLVNLNGIPATVVDPRPLRLRQFERRALLGLFHNTGPYAEYTDTPLDLLRGAGARAPGHARAFLDAPLVAALGRLAEALEAARRRLRQDDEEQRREGQQQQRQREEAGRQQQQQGQEQQHEQHEAHAQAPPPAAIPHQDDPTVARRLRRARRLLADSCARASLVEWTTHGLDDHEGADGGGGAADADEPGEEEEGTPGGVAAEQAVAPGAEGGSAGSGGSSSEASSSSSCSDSGSDSDGACPRPRRRGRGAQARAAAAAAAAAGLPADELDALLWTLLNCSCVLGMHPDAATDPAVALALALRKPFAVVPCCVYSQLFPKRRTADGAPVATTEQLVAYIRERAAAAGREAFADALPFEGKNVVVWSPAPPPSE